MGRRWYQFGPYRLDPLARTLTCDNEPVELTPKAVETLRVLVQRPGAVVSKETLLNEVWPGTFVEEGSLTRNICDLRRVLGGVNGDSLIQTVPRRGYRFLGAVREHEESAGQRQKSLAVAPFKVLDDLDDRTLGLRITDALITHLAMLKEFRLQSASAAARNRSSQKDGQAADQALEADYVLEGSVQKQNDQVRVTVQLVNTTLGTTTWAERFEESDTDIFRLADSLAEEISGAVALLLSTEQRKLLSRRYTESSRAYDLYLKGRFYWNQRSEGQIRRAISYFRKSLSADPEYAPAYSALSSSYAFLPMLSPVRPHEMMPKAKASAISALQIDETLAEARAALAFVKWHYDWNWDGAEHEFRRIIKFQPDHALAHQWYALLLAELGRFSEAIEQAAVARELDHSPSIQANQATVLYLAGKYQEATEVARETLTGFPDSLRARVALGLALQQMGLMEDAIRELEDAYRLSRRVPFICGALGYGYAVNGHTGTDLILRRLQNLPPRLADFGSQALIYAGSGLTDSALDLFEQACGEKEFHMVLLRVDPRLNGLRAHTRFQSLLTRIGLGGWPAPPLRPEN